MKSTEETTLSEVLVVHKTTFPMQSCINLQKKKRGKVHDQCLLYDFILHFIYVTCLQLFLVSDADMIDNKCEAPHYHFTCSYTFLPLGILHMHRGCNVMTLSYHFLAKLVASISQNIDKVVD